MKVTAWWGWIIVALVLVWLLVTLAGALTAVWLGKKYLPLVKMVRTMRR